ncbi:GRASP55/65 PDZ-like domain-containing protein [Peziza echinospora]|nr:GRASP55/65 PDZ-like domain-containing protein [Peziza echinospora]
MGNEQSQFSEGGGASEPYGFQVLRNNNPSLPTIEPWFDFICGINGRQIDDGNPILFQQEVWNCVAGRGGSGSVTLGVWSAKGQRLRDVVIPLSHYITNSRPAPSRIPSSSDSPYSTGGSTYGSTGSTHTLGLSLQWTPLTHSLSVWHILSIAPSSPSDLAGLLANDDYILPIPPPPTAPDYAVFTLNKESDLGSLVEAYLGRVLPLWVYNHEANVVRQVEITPKRGWGGEGVVGCVLGFGALHRLPIPVGEGGVVGPGGVLFDGGDAGGFPPLDGSGSSRNAYLPRTQTPQSNPHLPPSTPIQQRYNTNSPYSPQNQYPSPPPLVSPSTGEGGNGQYYIPALQAGPDAAHHHHLHNQHPPQHRSSSPLPPPPRPSSGASIHQTPPPRTKPRRPLHHHFNPQPGMDEYMRESEAASLEADRPGSGAGVRSGSPLPPPPKRGAAPAAAGHP